MTTPGAHSAVPPEEPEEPRVVVHDRRRVDPETGELREETHTGLPENGDVEAAHGEFSHSVDVEKLSVELAERTQDLQRITAEYANYRKRTEKERQQVAEQGSAVLMLALLPVLDDIERAREHGDLTGGFATVGEQLLTTLTKAGLGSFGEVGDVFDPTWHEAVAQSSESEDEPHVTQVLRRGYALGERLLRPAMVIVGEGPTQEAAAQDAAAGTSEPSSPQE